MKKIIIALTILMVATAWSTGVYKYYEGDPTDWTRIPKQTCFGIRINETEFSTITKIRAHICYYNYGRDRPWERANIILYDEYGLPKNIFPISDRIPRDGGWQEYNLNWTVPSTRPIYIGFVAWIYSNTWLELGEEDRTPYSGKSFKATVTVPDYRFDPNKIEYLNKDWFIEVWTEKAITGIAPTSLGRVKALYR